MNIFVACPTPRTSRRGNRVTAVRWARIFQQLGHRVRVGQDFDGKACDLLLALHARKSHAALMSFRRRLPGAPIVVCLTGTDVYEDLPKNAEAIASLDAADRIVALQPLALEELTPQWRAKARVIFQSAASPRTRPIRSAKWFDVSVAGHLRLVKDPLRTALALRHIPAGVPIRVTQVGEAIEPEYASKATRLMRDEPRYRWLGEVSQVRTRQILARSRVMVISSLLEGGANVVGEAVMLDTPVLASDVPGNRGLLGEGYPGYFPVGDDRRLAELLMRVQSDRSFWRKLRSWCRTLRPLFRESKERGAWRDLLRELCVKRDNG
jgi:putative glycosyltransferase (TIGR04348 family)